MARASESGNGRTAGALLDPTAQTRPGRPLPLSSRHRPVNGILRQREHGGAEHAIGRAVAVTREIIPRRSAAGSVLVAACRDWLVLAVGEEFGQAPRRFAGAAPTRRTVDETQRLRQPARAVEQPLGLLRHVAFLQMVDELRRRLALGLAHRFENAGLGDAAEIVVDGRPPARCTMSRPTARASRSAWSSRVLDAVGGDAALIVAVSRLVERVDRRTRRNARTAQRCAGRRRAR